MPSVARYEVLIAVLLKICVFWDVVPCGWVNGTKLDE